MIGQYVPKKFAKEYVRLKNSDQYPMFVAAALGVKRSYDDWIDVNVFDEFRNICKDYGLFIETDVVFRTPKTGKAGIVGAENITTTFQVGERFHEKMKEGEVHVFVSDSREDALKAKKFGWYSVVIGNRSINKPFVDHLRFGRLLGFPDCCVDFFRRYNNWRLYSHPHETYKNTEYDGKGAKGSYLCNNFLMDKTFFYIHHIPCSYRCENTIAYAADVENRIMDAEPGFVKKTRELLKRPLLVFGERNFMMFDGNMKGDEIRYRDSVYIDNPARPEDTVGFYDLVRKGDRILEKDGKLKICKGNRTIKTVDRKEGWFMLDFD